MLFILHFLPVFVCMHPFLLCHIRDILSKDENTKNLALGRAGRQSQNAGLKGGQLPDRGPSSQSVPETLSKALNLIQANSVTQTPHGFSNPVCEL